MFNSGEKPGKGKYRCILHPDIVVVLDNADDRLPPCPKHIPRESAKWERVY
jgi:hypothetical protein